MQGVVDHGTGYGARRMGLTVPAAGKTGTTNEGRDAWFVGFTPDLLAVVWVGFDKKEDLGLSGAQAALPIWTDFMKGATGDKPATPFLVPPGIQLATIDPESGELATPLCPERVLEAFFDGEAPTATCALHPEPGARPVAPSESLPALLPPLSSPASAATPAMAAATPGGTPPILVPRATPEPRRWWWPFGGSASEAPPAAGR
jgi:membrane carboxypeptidase/penicillin-binding protein